MLSARSPKYPALTDFNSGVRFLGGKAEVTEEQAFQLAERRFMDGILIDGQPAKAWARDQRRTPQDAPPLVPEPGPEPQIEDPATSPEDRRPKRARSN